MRLLVCASLLLAGAALAGPDTTRDPFRSPLVTEINIQPYGQAAAIFGQFAVEDLTLLGVVQTPYEPSVLLAGPDGTTHVVGEGAILGRRWAELTHIGEDSAAFLILSKDHEGVLVERRPELRLPER